MKNIKYYIAIITLLCLIAIMYGYTLRSMGINLGAVIMITGLFIGSTAVSCGLVLILTRGIRKKLNDELKNGGDNCTEN